ncbi:MAG: hypothetical protein RIG77_17370 [Cyclobacteriaceae bacterium]
MNTQTFYLNDIDDLVSMGQYSRDNIYDFFEHILNQGNTIILQQSDIAQELPPVNSFNNLKEFQAWRKQRTDRQQQLLKQLQQEIENASNKGM